MTPAKLERIAARLDALEAELLELGSASLKPTHRDGGDLPGKVDDDAAPLSEMNQVIASNRNRERSERLASIRAARARLKEDPEDFGICEGCNDPIPQKRLELMPWVELCIRCQEREEQERSGGRRHITDYK